MAARQNKLIRFLVLPLAGLLLAGVATATDFQVAQLARELTRASNQFAAELGSARGYNGVRFSAERLGREAGELVDAIYRGRSRSHVSAEFNDVARQYRALEEAFLRAKGGDHERGLYQRVSLISNLYSNLDAEFRYTHQARQPYYYPAPAIPRHRQRVPAQPTEGDNERPDRRDYGSIRARRVLEFDQGSAVLQRQLRQEVEQSRVRRAIERRHGAADGHRRSGRRLDR
ncbi:MAG: hypothetical protein WD396_06365 [Pseudohongiellaceae bacterium]